MTFNLYVLQNQWIVATLLAGIALMLLFCLTYSAMWRPKEEEKKAEETKVKGAGSFLRAFIAVVPWTIILVSLASAAYTITSLVLRSLMPPNW